MKYEPDLFLSRVVAKEPPTPQRTGARIECLAEVQGPDPIAHAGGASTPTPRDRRSCGSWIAGQTFWADRVATGATGAIRPDNSREEGRHCHTLSLRGALYADGCLVHDAAGAGRGQVRGAFAGVRAALPR